MGTVNVHGSLLPQYRGAAPINWAVINGEKETGVTTFKLKHEIDTGDILLQERIPIGDNETAGSLHDRMKEIGAQLLVRTVEGLANGSLQEIPQSEISNQKSEIKHASKIFTETCRINWKMPAEKVFNLVRGLSPYPAAFTELNGKKLKVYSCKKEFAQMATEPGKWDTDKDTYLRFASKDGWIYLQDLQLEGKKRMTVQDFLRGYRF
jgi:methionyl-tRNA formyltransferase